MGLMLGSLRRTDYKTLFQYIKRRTHQLFCVILRVAKFFPLTARGRYCRMEQFKGQPRLPKFAVPKRYDIRLKPDLSACKFGGSVAVDLDIVDDTRFIVLNAVELSVDNASVSFSPRRSSKVPPISATFSSVCYCVCWLISASAWQSLFWRKNFDYVIVYSAFFIF